MDITVFAAVLFSAIFQAGWNFFAKKTKANTIALLAVGWFIFGLVSLPIAIWQTDWSQYSNDWLIFILGSGFIHGIYICLLGWAYSVGEISVVYPVARGLGIVGTTIGSQILGLHGLSTFGLIGIVTIVTGTFLIGLKEIPLRQRRNAFLIAILVACSVSSYSILDSLGSKQVPIFFYVIVLNLVAPLLAAPFLAWKMRPEIMTVIKFHKIEGTLVALAGAFAYLIVLWGFQRSPTAYVATLREFSVVIACLLGVVFLKEHLYKRKIAGILLILMGIVCIKLA